jgi:triacylglycerol lipase
MKRSEAIAAVVGIVAATWFAGMTGAAAQAPAGPPKRPAQTVAGFPTPPYPGLQIARDLAYGSDPKQILDVIWPAGPAGRPRTIVIFVHGGGWAGGDKHAPGDDLYENVVHWAANQGMVGVNIDYRLADYKNNANLYPTQEQDVAAAIRWVKANAKIYGGDPNRIYLWGHSSGGSAIGGYLANPAFQGPAGPGVKGAFLLSSPLDPAMDEANGRPVAYYGKTHEDFVAKAAIKTLASNRVPLLFGYSSDEGGPAPPQVIAARKVLCDAGRCPPLVLTKGSHQGEMMAVDTADTSATDAFLAFIKANP